VRTGGHEFSDQPHDHGDETGSRQLIEDRQLQIAIPAFVQKSEEPGPTLSSSAG
jgi:hypothetical protein